MVHGVIEVRQTAVFAKWFVSLKDARAKARIQIRIDRVELGNPGDVKFFSGIGELRIDYGPGYRVYFVKRGNTIVILLCGGDKATQQRDVRQAIEMAQELD
jgi:putative addiction module killer protein